MLEIWLASTLPLKANQYDRKDLLNVLSRDELNRYDRYRYDKERRLYLIAHYMKRTVLSLHYPYIKPSQWQFQARYQGKPEIADICNIDNLHFNISHSNDTAALAVSFDSPCGIDIELKQDKIDYLGLAKRFFHQDEYLDIEEKGRDGFYEYWTIKEAYIKLVGTGLHCPLNSFRVRALPNDTIRIDTPDSHAENYLNMWCEHLSDGYSLAYAVYSNCARLQPKARWLGGFEPNIEKTIPLSEF